MLGLAHSVAAQDSGLESMPSATTIIVTNVLIPLFFLPYEC